MMAAGVGIEPTTSGLVARLAAPHATSGLPAVLPRLEKNEARNRWKTAPGFKGGANPTRKSGFVAGFQFGTAATNEIPAGVRQQKRFSWRMITSVLFLIVAVTAFFLSWYFMRYTKVTRGPGSWAMDRLLVFLAGAFFCFGIVMAMAALKLFLLRS